MRKEEKEDGEEDKTTPTMMTIAMWLTLVRVAVAATGSVGAGGCSEMT